MSDNFQMERRESKEQTVRDTGKRRFQFLFTALRCLNFCLLHAECITYLNKPVASFVQREIFTIFSNKEKKNVPLDRLRILD